MKEKEIPLLTPEKFREKYYTNEPAAKPFGFKGFYMTTALLGRPIKAHRKTVYDFLFLTKGSCDKYKGIDSYEVRKNEIFFVPAYQISGSSYITDDARGFYCAFSLDFFSQLFIVKDFFKKFKFLQFNGYPHIKIGKDGLAPILALMQRIEKEYLEQEADWKDRLGMYLLTLFFELNKFDDSEDSINSNAALRITTQFKRALYQHFKEKQKVTDYAELLAVSPNHLNKSIKTTTGKSAHELIQDMIVIESKALLQQTELPVSDIAYQFAKTPTEFSRFFKAKTGISPTDYRIVD